MDITWLELERGSFGVRSATSSLEEEQVPPPVSVVGEDSDYLKKWR